MDQLQSIFVDAGFKKVSTLIASGNVWFHTPLKSVTNLRIQIEQSMLDSLGFEVDTFLRTDVQLESAYNANPFANAPAIDEQVHVHVIFFHDPLPKDILEVLRRNETTTDRMEMIGTEAYWRCHGRMTDSDYWNQPDIKKIKLPPHTVRNIQTLKRMLDT